MKKQMVGLLCAIATGAVNVSASATTVKSYVLSDTITAELDDQGVLTIKGSGSLPSYIQPQSAPWRKDRRQVYAIDLDEGITNIGWNAFHEFYSLTNISFNAVKTIDVGAFESCTSLTEVVLSSAVNIGSAFFNCTALTKVELPSAVTIESGAFGMTALTEISLPKVTTIGDGVFAGIASLTNIEADAAIVVSGSGLAGTSLPEISLPNATTIGNQCFRDCRLVETISIPSAIEIGKNAFQGCSSLKRIYVHTAMRNELMANPSFYGLDSFDGEIIEIKQTKDEAEQTGFVVAVMTGDRVCSVSDYNLACEKYKITPKPEPQIVGENEVAVNRNVIESANAETVKIEDGVIHLGISVSRSEDITAPTADWNKVTISKDDIDVSEDGTQIIVKIPADAQQGFMILQSKDAKVNTED